MGLLLPEQRCCCPPPCRPVEIVEQTGSGVPPATLFVTVTGTGPVTYQWYEGPTGDTSTPIIGATASSYVAENAGSYWVRATNPCGTADSGTMLVCAPATITVEPAELSTTPATLTVVATGTPTLTYQWYQGVSGDTGTPIIGATSDTYVATDPGNYWVRVSNGCGSDDSITAVVESAASFTDDFTNLDAWTVENGGGTVQATDNQLVFSGSADFGRVHRQAANRAPASWTQIEIACEVFVTGQSNNDFSLGVCMDDPATGSPDFNAFSFNRMVTGYACLFRPQGWTEKVGRFTTGNVTNLRDANDTNLMENSWRTLTVTITKMVDRIRIERVYNGAALPVVDDTDAGRHTGACGVVLSGWAVGGNVTMYRNLAVTVT